MIKVSTNAGTTRRGVKKTAERTKKVEIAHKKISIMLDAWVQRNFKSQGRSVGKWKPFARYCVGGPRSPYGLTKDCGKGRVLGKGAKRRLDRSAKLLQDTGALRLSFKPFSDRKTAGIGSKLKYSKPHEKGEGHLPMRRMLPKTRDVTKEVERIYEEHIWEAFEKYD